MRRWLGILLALLALASGVSVRAESAVVDFSGFQRAAVGDGRWLSGLPCVRSRRSLILTASAGGCGRWALASGASVWAESAVVLASSGGRLWELGVDGGRM